MAKPDAVSKYRKKKDSGIIGRNWVSGKSKFDPYALPGDYHRDDSNPRHYAEGFQRRGFVPRFLK